MEYHGQFPDVFETWVHVWPKAGASVLALHQGNVNHVPASATPLDQAFHTYGVLVEREWITFYLDANEIWRTAAPPQAEQPLFVLLNLALGSGYPIEHTPNPSFMYVDYVRVYSRNQSR
ncbi:MAG: hypothetical protein NVSMB26_00070 [Beijerinckiaceae bacterium]